MRKAIFAVLTVVALGVFLFSGWQLWRIFDEYHTGEKLYETTAGKYVTPAPEKGQTPAAPGNQDSPEADSPAAATASPILVDFDALTQANADVVAWLCCPDTLINYPVVHAADNDTYLHRLLDGTENSTGTIFLDFRNSGDISDRNSILYGHNMKNNTMFGTLPEYKDQAYYDAHPVMWLLTPEQTYRVDLVAGVVVDTESELYTFWLDSLELEERLDWAVSRSTFRSGVAVSEVERVLVLSTCSYEFENARYVLLGSLVPVED